MAQYNYSHKKYNENMARVVGRDLPISTKQSIEICKRLRKMELSKAKEKLERVLAFKEPIPFTRFTEGAGHKKGMAGGRYPINACTQILKLLNSVENNSQNKGLGSTRIVHISAQKAAQRWHYGRKRRRRMKRTHIEIVVEEMKEKKKAAVKKEMEAKKEVVKEEKIEAKKPAAVKKEEPKVDVKKEAVKEEEKEADKTESKDSAPLPKVKETESKDSESLARPKKPVAVKKEEKEVKKKVPPKKAHPKKKLTTATTAAKKTKKSAKKVIK